MEVLVQLGFVLTVGFVVAKLFRLVGIPQVVGFIAAGVLLGKTGFGFLDESFISTFQPLVVLSLGIIGFNIGRELNFNMLRQMGSKLLIVLLSEVLGAFTLVCGSIYLITGEPELSILLGALASATAPAATVDVLWEFGAKGSLTQTLLFILALDDVVAIILSSFAIAYAQLRLAGNVISITEILGVPLLEIAGSGLLGLALGFGLSNLYRLKHTRGDTVVLTLASVLFCSGVAEYLGLSPILSNIILGAAFCHLTCGADARVLEETEDAVFPLIIWLFILIGASMDVRVAAGFIPASIIYFVSRSAGKTFGSMFGATLAEMEDKVRRYLGFCLFSQAGVTLGLAFKIYYMFHAVGAPASTVGTALLNIVVAGTFLTQFIGPIMVKYAIFKAGEATLNGPEARES